MGKNISKRKERTIQTRKKQINEATIVNENEFNCKVSRSFLEKKTCDLEIKQV